MNLKVIGDFYRKWRKRFFIAFFLVFGIWYAFCLPDVLFTDPTSTVVNDANGRLLSAMISDDDQWHFPEGDTVPEKYRVAVLEFEDHRFYRHIGISFMGLGRALVENIKAGRLVSGGSTITMQVIRMHRKRKGRGLLDKLYEMILATRLELAFSKDEILRMYAAHAPFGGNVIGLEAASWRYFGGRSAQLTWAQSATLAVLPNSPALIHPGRNRERLSAKRNRLLRRLHDKGYLSGLDLELALAEPLPDKPVSIPQDAYHLMQHAINSGKKGKRVETSLDGFLQRRLNTLAQIHYDRNKLNEIHNLGIVVLDVHTGECVAYIGNSPCTRDKGVSVDMIRAERSSGSILKPFLYAHQIEAGELAPSMLLMDVPTRISGYSPENYNKKYEGMIRADLALAKSLNVPAVRQLMQHGVPRFKDELAGLGMTTLHRPADDYGLSLILGGAESSLWDLANMYRAMAAHLNPLDTVSGIQLSKGSVYLTFSAMTRVIRPGLEGNWAMFENNRRVAWKTGTSYGARDAWALGVTPDYVVAVWVGNSSGEGRPGLTGFEYAAPLLFDVFNSLPATGWFKRPEREMVEFQLCRHSGYRKGPHCENEVKQWLPQTGDRLPVCPYHATIHLSDNGKYRVWSDCYPVWQMRHEKRFILPPVAEKFYLPNHPGYRSFEPLHPLCGESEYMPIELVYPKPDVQIFIPLTQDGSTGRAVLEAVHKDPDATIYWHLDDVYLGATKHFHQMEVYPGKGVHHLVVTDHQGISVKRRFEVLSGD